ncbi:hypothetical protein V2W45_1416687 [Cenococcum geophilum]
MLEYSGKSPSIVLADGNLDQAAKRCHIGIMDHKGDPSTSCIYVHESIYDMRKCIVFS